MGFSGSFLIHTTSVTCPHMSSTSKKSKAKADVKKVGRGVKKAGKDVEVAVEKGAHDIKRAGQKIKKKV